MKDHYMNYQSLTLSEKNCFGKLEALGDNVTIYNLHDLSEYCSVSTTTVNRTLKKMGYNNLKQYKLEMHKLNDNTNLNNNSITNFENKVIYLINTFNDSLIEELIKSINESQKIYVVAFGITSSIGIDFYLHLKYLGYNVTSISDSGMLEVINDDQNSLIIYISYSGCDYDMDNTSTLYKHKVNQALITCTTNSALSKNCNLVLNTDTQRYDNYLKSRLPIQIIINKILEKLYTAKK